MCYGPTRFRTNYPHHPSLVNLLQLGNMHKSPPSGRDRVGHSILLSSLVFGASIVTTRAANYVWDGGSSADSRWSTADNWEANLAPSSGVDTTILFSGAIRLDPLMDGPSPFNLGGFGFTSSAGAFALSGGALQLNANAGGTSAAILQNSAAAITVSNPLVLAAKTVINGNGTGTLNLSGVISGTGGIEMNGAGELILSGENTFGGTVTLRRGVLTFASSAARGFANQFNFEGGRLRSGGDMSISGGILVGSAGGTIDTGAYSLSLYSYSSAQSTTGELRKAGSGTLVLTGPFLTTAPLVVQEGSVRLQSGTALTESAVTLNAGSQLEIVSQAATIPSLQGSGALSLGASLSISSQQIGSDFSGKISGTGSLEIYGRGNVFLRGNNDFTGGVTLRGGTLEISSDANLGASSAPFRFGSGGGALYDSPLLRVSDSITIARQIVMGSYGPIDIGANNVVLTGQISGGAIEKRGTGTLTVEGANSSQGFVLVEGVLQARAASQLGTGVTLMGGSFRTLDSMTLSRLSYYAAGGTIDTNGFDLQLGRLVTAQGGATLHKTGAGTLLIGGVSSFFKDSIDIAMGTVRLNAEYVFSGETNINLNAGAVLDLGGFNTSIANLTGTGSVVLGNRTLYMGLGNSTFGGTISGTGALHHSNSTSTPGTYRLTLTGSNTYTGGTAITNGSLAVGANEVLADGGAVTIDYLGTFDVGQYQETIGALTLFGRIEGSTGVLRASSYDVRSGHIFAKLSGNGSLTKNASTNVLLHSDSTYTGQTTINAGELVINGSITSHTVVGQPGMLSGNGTVHEDVVNAGTLEPGNFTDLGGTLTIDGDYQQLSSGVLTLRILSNTESSTLHVTGLFNAGGTLRLTLEQGVQLSAGNRFQVFDFDALSGTFATIDAPELTGLFKWDFSELYSAGVIAVVPEPGASMALVMGALAIGCATRRRTPRPATEDR